MSDLISRCELFNRLATIPASPEANELKAQIYAVIQSMETYECKDSKDEDDKHAVCHSCNYYELPSAFHPCASCVDFSKYEPMKDCQWR